MSSLSRVQDDIQEQLAARNLSTRGPVADLRSRLVDAQQREALGPDAEPEHDERPIMNGRRVDLLTDPEHVWRLDKVLPWSCCAEPAQLSAGAALLKQHASPSASRLQAGCSRRQPL